MIMKRLALSVLVLTILGEGQALKCTKTTDWPISGPVHTGDVDCPNTEYCIRQTATLTVGDESTSTEGMFCGNSTLDAMFGTDECIDVNQRDFNSKLEGYSYLCRCQGDNCNNVNSMSKCDCPSGPVNDKSKKIVCKSMDDEGASSDVTCYNSDSCLVMSTVTTEEDGTSSTTTIKGCIPNEKKDGWKLDVASTCSILDDPNGNKLHVCMCQGEKCNLEQNKCECEEEDDIFKSGAGLQMVVGLTILGSIFLTNGF